MLHFRNVYEPDNPSPARVNRKTGEVVINRYIFDTMPRGVQLIVLLHEAGHYFNNTSNELIADRFAQQIIAGKIPQSLKSIVAAANSHLDINNNAGHRQRGLKAIQYALQTDFEQYNNYEAYSLLKQMQAMNTAQQYAKQIQDAVKQQTGVELTDQEAAQIVVYGAELKRFAQENPDFVHYDDWAAWDKFKTWVSEKAAPVVVNALDKFEDLTYKVKKAATPIISAISGVPPQIIGGVIDARHNVSENISNRLQEKFQVRHGLPDELKKRMIGADIQNPNVDGGSVIEMEHLAQQQQAQQQAMQTGQPATDEELSKKQKRRNFWLIAGGIVVVVVTVVIIYSLSTRNKI